MLKKYSLLIGLLIFALPRIEAQELPNLPPSIKWQQIKSEHFKIIYPKGLEAEAQRTTNILENIYKPASHSLGASPRRFPVILQNQHAISNGFVTVAPFHSEFYMYEPQNYRHQGNDRWLERLAVHEYRHMVQFEKAITPFNKALYFLTGEYGPFMAAAAAAPQWFFEGDAVGIETALGRTGRGRIPSFLMAFKANLIEKEEFNYYKQYLKSYKDFVPNHYVTGYLMTTYLKNKSGVDIWDKILGRSFAQPYMPFTFSNSMKKATGKHLVPTYNEMLAEQKQLYTEQLEQISPTKFTAIPHQTNKKFTNYYYPRKVLNDQVLVVKIGFSDIASFVLIDEDGKEETSYQLGTWLNPEALSSNDSTVVWTELELDSRWQRRTYSVIKKLNLETGEATRLTKKSKYLAPSISPDGKLVAAIHQSVDGLFSIHLLNARNGELIKAFENKENALYSVPQFDLPGENLLVLKNRAEGKAIILKNIQSGKEQELYFSDRENLGNPVLHDGWLYYATDYNGIDNIHALNLVTKETYQVTNSKFGAFHPRVSKDNQIFYNDYTADGFEMASTPVDANSWTKIEDVKYIGFNFEKEMVEEEGFEDVLYNYPDTEYSASKYHKMVKAFRPHTWGLNAIPDNSNYSVGMTSKDLLETTTMSASAIYNNNENTWRGKAKVSYQALYPIIDVSFGFGNRAARARLDDGSLVSYQWTENVFESGIRVPFYLTNSRYNQRANLSAGYNYIHAYDYRLPTNVIITSENQKLFSLDYSAQFSRLLKKSFLDLNSKWGQTLYVGYQHTPLGGNIHGELLSAQSNLYFPGLFDHHSLHLRGALEFANQEDYQFSSPINFTRGYNYQSFDEFVNLSVNYKLPLIYIDWHLGPIINLQRVYTNVFFDQGIGRDADQPDDLFYSIGAEVSFNFNLFRLLPLIDMGVRYSYLPNANDQVIEIIFGGVTF
ncbi:hypothetical protein SAMN04488029_2217 [Reichenbachiella faecimaris]|uniref:WD40-like Beta Propeller Repeat n=1 Tax=Reichenbachiella faecimaris TaxID=692418 RepID=A0A1W2GEC1_REIFA|nr:hypothetical protein [Reichenbachiella faecimaris]SMD34864.1 hypothetical protein SAMN04488029_2217 [Reichenbachiella faecimaris]